MLGEQLRLGSLVLVQETHGSQIELVQYGHLRYNYPELQLFPAL